MINLTKEQIKESLTRLREYGRWMYFDKEAIKKLELQTREYKNEKFSIYVNSDGTIAMKIEGGPTGIFEAKCISDKCLPGSLDNVNHLVRLINENDLRDEFDKTNQSNYYVSYFKEAGGAFISSYFQRSIAFLFFARIHDETLDGVANDLEMCNKK